jgi:hypothetical protein
MDLRLTHSKPLSDFDLDRITTNEGVPSLRGFRKGGNSDDVQRGVPMLFKLRPSNTTKHLSLRSLLAAEAFERSDDLRGP